MKIIVSIYIDMQNTVQVEVEAEDHEEAIHLACEKVSESIELDRCYIEYIRDSSFDPASLRDDFRCSISPEHAMQMFSYVKSFWPAEIHITELTLLPGNAADIPQLVDACDLVDQEIERLADASLLPDFMDEHTYGEIAYCFAGVLHKKARGGDEYLYPAAMSFEEFEKYFCEKHEGWAPH